MIFHPSYSLFHQSLQSHHAKELRLKRLLTLQEQKGVQPFRIELQSESLCRSLLKQTQFNFEITLRTIPTQVHQANDRLLLMASKV
jgi:hypothetical protein